MNKHLKGILKVLAAMLLLAAMIPAAALADYSIQVADDDLSVTQGLDENWLNILLIGTDTREHDLDSGRSDTMIVCSINRQTGVIKLTSLARDTWVEIGDNGVKNKLNAAHSFGGPNLLMQTINRLLGLNIEHYVTINFEGVVDVVDTMGGVTLELESAEVGTINSTVGRDLGRIDVEPLERGAGERTLCGAQALAYMRIRSLDNDFGRTDRQRKLLTALLDKVRDCSAFELMGLVTTGMSYVKTNLSVTQILGLAMDVIGSGVNGLETCGLPSEGNFHYDSADGTSKIIVDKAQMKQEIHEIIYGE